MEIPATKKEARAFLKKLEAQIARRKAWLAENPDKVARYRRRAKTKAAEYQRNRREKLKNDPVARDAHKARRQQYKAKRAEYQRKRYASLTAAQREKLRAKKKARAAKRKALLQAKVAG